MVNDQNKKERVSPNVKVPSELEEKKLSIENVNQMEKEEFVNRIGWVFEHSPWVSSQVSVSRSFKSREELFQSMVTVVKHAEKSLQLALLRAHPDLGTRLIISEVSQKEQAGVGLDQLSKDEYREFISLNQRYVDQFSFPFIMAVKGQTKQTILAAMQQRVCNSYEQEFQTALSEVFKIARFRLNDVIQ
ncbi:2-oxo-4-hydroxy-4-carboxy-5-ureidoimidazoline decarboxylase [Neobacillus drentensis]